MTKCEVASFLSFAVLLHFANIAVCVDVSSMHDKPVVNTTYGPVVGTSRETSAGATVFSFFGIPFAQPPLGSLRWRAPMPPKPWVEPLDLSSMPTVAGQCLQNPPADEGTISGGTEDCLKIHAYTPHLTSQGGQALPVMLWIHGGGFVDGDAWEVNSNGTYDGMGLAQRFQVVVFAAQYRLGILGFLALEQLQQEDPNHSTGNYGLMDQRAAMRWVRDNAAAFGGDPQRVTIFGESAGGESMCYHLVSPASRGLFDAVIMESGSCDLQVDTVASKQSEWKTYSELTNCTWGSPEYLECLRAMDGAALQRMVQQADGIPGLTIDGTRVGLPDVPMRMLSSGIFNKVPAIVGVNNFEFNFNCTDTAHLEKCEFLGSFFDYTIPKTQDIRYYFEIVFERNLSDVEFAEILKMYPLEEFEGNMGKRVSAMGIDAGFDGPHGKSAFVGECGTLRAAQAIARAGVPVWMYHMKRLGTLDFVQHATEVPFVFQKRHVAFWNMSQEENRMASHLIGEYWTNFAKFHDPNRATRSGGQNNFWPILNASSPILAVFDGTTQTPSHPLRAPFCKFWQSLLGEHSMQGDIEPTLVV